MTEGNQKIRGIAHRGYPGKAPENTLKSFQWAIDLNFSHLELDVQLSKDGEVIVMHDWTVDRVCGEPGTVRDMTLAELKRLRVGGVEEVPTLEETLELCRGKLIVSIELKQGGDYYAGLEEKVVERVRRLRMTDQVYIISFDQYSVVKVKQLCPEVEVGIILGGNSPFLYHPLQQMGASYLAVPLKYLNEDAVEQCSKHGLQLITWPADNAEQIAKVTPYPDVLVTTNELEIWRDHAIRTGQFWTGK
ncbi:glycerophosphodiester phosphodiesterase family protein [Paenibacillus aurantius]|uniref:Glycerophosphodiester phosphodiesterase family protein n=1 Tax=Paenibacillus aurantius TaxID=2918900 RepID=A0AA96L9H6_9BACL|nr:glycerophosphodiester phosphodiesterase family protein [Paenibacillus aurantius]WNQ08974.1 glycerophosphodiester phosphodiesterase family protein [Paenibacillus aurantius]